MPKDIVIRLNAEIRKIVERPDIKSQLPSAAWKPSRARRRVRRVLKGTARAVENLITAAGIEKQ